MLFNVLKTYKISNKYIRINQKYIKDKITNKILSLPEKTSAVV